MLFSDSASRLVGDNSGVEPKLGGDRLATELGKDGIYIGLMLFQRSVLGLCVAELMSVESRYAGSRCIRDLID